MLIPVTVVNSGFTPSYLGYNTIGGSQETMTANRIYMKRVVPTSSGLLVSVEAYLQAASPGDLVTDFGVAILSDNAGAPLTVSAYNWPNAQSVLMETAVSTGAARWIGVPLAFPVTAGTAVWIAVGTSRGSSLLLSYDATGSDRYYTAGGAWFTDAGFTAVTTGANAYSMRALAI